MGNLIGNAPKFRIYTGTTDDNKQVIMKVAKTFEDGDILAEEASKFNLLRVFESQIAALQEKKGDGNAHFDWLFASLMSSFMEPTQGDRRINVYAMPDVDLSELVPLKTLHNRTEIDARTSIWILGRFLKFYSFFELMALSDDNPIVRYPLFSADDYLIGPEQHRLIYYNYSGDMADVLGVKFVKSIAKFILDWVVVGDSPEEQKYLSLLSDFAKNGRGLAGEAHKDLYTLVRELWGVQYYPFTYRDRNTITWKKMQEVNHG